MRTFMLLDRETPLLEVLRAGKENGPIEVVDGTGSIPSDVHESFRSANVALQVMLSNMRCGIASMYLYYTMDQDISSRIYGKSAGLAFAVAAMYEILNQPPAADGIFRSAVQTMQGVLIKIAEWTGFRLPGTWLRKAVGKCQGRSLYLGISREKLRMIAATGVISDLETGQIGRVDAIEDKLRTALEILPVGAIIFFPEDNKDEIPEDLRQTAKSRDICLQPVNTLKGVFRYLFHLHNNLLGLASGIRHSRSFFTCIFLFGLWLSYVVFSVPLGLYLLEYARFDWAQRHLNTARYVAFFNPFGQKLREDFERPLHVEAIFTVRYQTGKEESHLLDCLPSGLTLSPNDMFALRIIPSEPIYTYAFIVEPTGVSRLLYPVGRQDSYIAVSKTLPEKGIFFRNLSNSTASDICVVLSRWRCRALEERFQSSDTSRFSADELSRYQIDEPSVRLRSIRVVHR